MALKVLEIVAYLALWIGSGYAYLTGRGSDIYGGFAVLSLVLFVSALDDVIQGRVK